MRQDKLSRILAAVSCATICTALAGCGGGRNYEGDQRFAVSGNVTVDGEPMEHGLIAFMPLGDARVAGEPITNGTYSIPEEKGPNAGSYRIEIHWNVKTGKMGLNPDTGVPEYEIFKEGLPPRYHKNSELTAEVGPDHTTFDFELKSE